MGRRTLLLIAALVVAALGTVLIFVYVRNADQRANQDAKLVEVLVATSDVAAGTTAQAASGDGAFELQEVRDVDAAPGALNSVDIISDQIALAPIFEGQQILTQMFGAPGTEAKISVPKGQIAISVQLGDPERVAGFVVPGSSVSIFATVPGATTEASDTTRVLLPDVDVIGVGATTVSTTTTTTDSGESTTEEIPRTVLTLAVDQRQAEQIINAQSFGQLYFGLRGADAKVKVGGGTSSQNLFR